MAETVRAVDYFYMLVPDKPGEGARILGTLKKAGVNLLAYSGFPSGRGAQLDFVPADAAAFQAVARQNKWKVKGPKRAFVIDGDDRVGACWEILDKLAAAKINVTAMDAVAAGDRGWGAILWAKTGADTGRDGVHRGHVDRKSTRLNSSHANISYAVFCLKKKTYKRITASRKSRRLILTPTGLTSSSSTVPLPPASAS